MLFYMDIIPSGADIENQLLKARNKNNYKVHSFGHKSKSFTWDKSRRSCN